MTALMLLKAALRKRPLRLILIALCASGCFLSSIGLGAAGDTLRGAFRKNALLCGGGDINIYTSDLPRGELEKRLALTGAIRVSEGTVRTQRCLCSDGRTRTVRFHTVYGEVLRPLFDGAPGAALSLGYTADFKEENVRFLRLPDGTELETDSRAYLPGLNAVYTDRYNPCTDGDVVDIILTSEVADSLFSDSYVNFAAAVYPPAADLSAVLDNLSAMKDTKYAVRSESEAAFASARSLLETVLDVCAYLPVFIFAVGAVFILFFLSGTARAMRASLSLLLTDGAGKRDVFCGLFLMALLPMLAGLVLSLPAAAALGRAVSRETVRNMGMMWLGFRFKLPRAALSLLVCLFISALSALACVSFISRRSVAEIRKKPGGRKRAAALDFVTTALCTCAALGLALVTMFYGDSLSAVRSELLYERRDFDAQVIYSSLVPVSRLEELMTSGFVSDCEGVLFGTATVHYGDKSEEVFGAAARESGSMLRFYDSAGERVNPVSNMAVLDEKTAEKLGVNAGDIVDIDAGFGRGRISVRCRVAALTRQYSAFTQLISQDTAEQYLDSSGVMNSALVKLGGPAEDFVRFASSLPEVYSVQTVQSMTLRFDRRYCATLRLIRLVITDAALLGLALCLLMSYAAHRRNLKKNSVLLMLGESPLRLAAKASALRLTGFAAGFAAAMPLSVLIERLILNKLSRGTVNYPLVIKPGTVLQAAALIFVYLFASAAFFTWLLRKARADRLQE